MRNVVHNLDSPVISHSSFQATVCLPVLSQRVTSEAKVLPTHTAHAAVRPGIEPKSRLASTNLCENIRTLLRNMRNKNEYGEGTDISYQRTVHKKKCRDSAEKCTVLQSFFGLRSVSASFLTKNRHFRG